MKAAPRGGGHQQWAVKLAGRPARKIRRWTGARRACTPIPTARASDARPRNPGALRVDLTAPPTEKGGADDGRGSDLGVGQRARIARIRLPRLVVGHNLVALTRGEIPLSVLADGKVRLSTYDKRSRHENLPSVLRTPNRIPNTPHPCHREGSNQETISNHSNSAPSLASPCPPREQLSWLATWRSQSRPPFLENARRGRKP